MTPPSPSSRAGTAAIDARLARLARSSFRSRFALGAADVRYARERGRRVIADHAARFVAERLAPAEPRNDGRQTPMHGHPVFRAQHATPTCCRGCLEKHHAIAAHRPLSPADEAYVVTVIMRWIDEHLARVPVTPPAPDRRDDLAQPPLL